MKKYCTFHLLIIAEDKYIDGACISVSTYREYGNKMIEHNILIDKSISERGRKKLRLFFDNVLEVPLQNIKSDFALKTEKIKKRYGLWIDYSWAKWYILWFDNYEKILFCDIDTLAVKNYTDIFEVSTPAWCTFQKNSLQKHNLSKLSGSLQTGQQITDKFIKLYTGKSISELCKHPRNVSYIPVNASIVLLQPSKQKFIEMRHYIHEQINRFSYLRSITISSGPDENLLFKFYLCKLQVPVYCIGPEYLTSEWLLKKSPTFTNIKSPIILNFDSTDKPWLKKRADMYKEEVMWDDLRYKYKI